MFLVQGSIYATMLRINKYLLYLHRCCMKNFEIERKFLKQKRYSLVD